MNGELSADLKTPAKCILRPQLAALSFMLNRSGAGAGFERCSGIPSNIKEEFIRETTKCPREVVMPSTSVVEPDNNVSSGSTGGYLGEHCWVQCGERSGYCPQFCGRGLCCRQGWTGNGCNGNMGDPAHHVCVPDPGRGPPKFRNIGYVLSGYDILTGNPVTKGNPDPGIKAPIFKAAFDEGQTTADERYSVPNGMDSLSCGGTCNMDFSSSLIAGAKSYQKQLETKVEASFGIPFIARFTASTGFKKMEQSSKAHSTLYTMTEASCCAYWVCLNSAEQPPFNNNFKTELNSLPEEYNANAYIRFISIFGTHYIREARMGARYGEQSTISKESWGKMVSDGVNVGVAASYSGKFSIGGSTMTNTEKSEAESFRRETSEQNIYSIGKAPPANGDSNAWMQGILEEPQPIFLKLEPLNEMRALIQYLEHKPTVVENIKRAMGGYCSSLMEKGIVSSCQGLPEDPSFPGTSVDQCYYFKDYDKKQHERGLSNEEVCRSHGHVWTKGKNANFPDCGTCWCCTSQPCVSRRQLDIPCWKIKDRRTCLTSRDGRRNGDASWQKWDFYGQPCVWDPSNNNDCDVMSSLEEKGKKPGVDFQDCLRI